MIWGSHYFWKPTGSKNTPQRVKQKKSTISFHRFGCWIWRIFVAYEWVFFEDIVTRVSIIQDRYGYMAAAQNSELLVSDVVWCELGNFLWWVFGVSRNEFILFGLWKVLKLLYISLYKCNYFDRFSVKKSQCKLQTQLDNWQSHILSEASCYVQGLSMNLSVP